MPKIASIVACTLFMCVSMGADSKLSLADLTSDVIGDVKDLTSPGSLWRSRAFVTIAANSAKFETDALTMLESATASEEKKQVIVYAMQTLPKMDYLLFFGRVADAYGRGKCSDMVMALTMDPGFDWGCVVVQNYKSAYVDSKLQSIISSAHASEVMKDAVKLIVSGKRFNRMLVYFESEDDRGSNASRLPIKIWAESQQRGRK